MNEEIFVCGVTSEMSVPVKSVIRFPADSLGGAKNEGFLEAANIIKASLQEY